MRCWHSSCVTCRHLQGAQKGHRKVVSALNGVYTSRCLACQPVLSSFCKTFENLPAVQDDSLPCAEQYDGHCFNLQDMQVSLWSAKCTDLSDADWCLLILKSSCAVSGTCWQLLAAPSYTALCDAITDKAGRTAH